MHPRWAFSFLLVGGLLALGASLDLFGESSDSVLSTVTIAAAGALIVGIVRNRPAPRRVWALLPVPGILFSIAAAARDALGAKGDISAYKTLLPDYFSVPGYLVFATFLVLLLRSRRRLLSDSGVALETAMLALGSFLVAWVFLIAPVLVAADLPLATKVSFSLYPPLSGFLVALTARLVLTHGDRRVSHRLFLLGMLAMLLGDITYFLSDTGTFTPPRSTVDLPYSLAFVLIGAAVLHPTVGFLAEPVRPASARTARDTARALVVVLPLLITPALLVFWRPSDRIEQAVVGSCALLLTGLAGKRLLTAMEVQSRSEARFAFLATHDALTGLRNRNGAMLYLEQAIASGEPFAVLFLDLDHFKLVNDSLGHPVGDRLLRAAAVRLRSIVGNDTFVARISGDEFVVVIEARTSDHAFALAESIRDGFTQPLDIGAEVFSTVSVGVSYYDRNGSQTPAELIADADNAMYRSKASGRNAVTMFDVGMRENLARRLQLEADLRLALQQNGLQVHYQPIVGIRSGRVEGFEALVRWPTPQGWVSPAEFIPVAEDSGLIVPLGAMVLHEACRQLSRWRARPEWANFTMSVNVSAQQLRSSEFVALVANVLDATGLPGDALWLEITESLMMQDTQEMLERLEAIRELGVRFSIDDFGTGYSSLSYLRQFPIDRVKIDRAFVVDLVDAPERSLAGAIIAIADSLTMDTVAEGIESETQLVQLAAMGCAHAQGFFIARPMASGDVERRIEELDLHPLSELPSIRATAALAAALRRR